MKLARLCSQAVDFPKNGIAVNAQDMPRQLIPFKPDWKRGDNAITRDTEFYESTRALGVMFRSENLSLGEGPLVQPLKISPTPQPLGDPISNALRETITRVLGHFENSDRDVGSIKPLFLHYASELKYISYTHSLSDSPDSRLKEEEIVVGTILDNCANNSYRKNRMYRMGVHSQVLLREVRDRLYVQGEDEQPSRLELEEGLSRAWCAWDFGMRNRAEFGANSFALIALGVVMDILVKELKEIDLTTHVSPTEDDDVEDDEE